MAIEAGRIVTVADFQRLIGAETVRTANSAGFTTTEIVLDSVTVNLVANTAYRVVWIGQMRSSVAATDIGQGTIREDSVSGTIVQVANVLCAGNAGAQPMPLTVEGRYTPVSTGAKTFVATGNRNRGTGTITSTAAGNNPTLFRVELV